MKKTHTQKLVFTPNLKNQSSKGKGRAKIKPLKKNKEKMSVIFADVLTFWNLGQKKGEGKEWKAKKTKFGLKLRTCARKRLWKKKTGILKKPKFRKVKGHPKKKFSSKFKDTNARGRQGLLTWSRAFKAKTRRTPPNEPLAKITQNFDCGWWVNLVHSRCFCVQPLREIKTTTEDCFLKIWYNFDQIKLNIENSLIMLLYLILGCN